jgi:hypothetical protein
VQDYLNQLGREGAFGTNWVAGRPWGLEVQQYMLELGKAGAFGPDWPPLLYRECVAPWERPRPATPERKPKPKPKPKPNEERPLPSFLRAKSKQLAVDVYVMTMESSFQNNLRHLAGQYVNRLLEERFSWDESLEMKNFIPGPLFRGRATYR